MTKCPKCGSSARSKIKDNGKVRIATCMKCKHEYKYSA